MEIEMIRPLETSDYACLMEIWQSAVLNTHDFLTKEDFLYYKDMLPTYFQHVRLFGYEQDNVLIGFIGVSEDKLEMLFIDNKHRGTGVGRALISYAIEELHVTKVDVNEQNTQAIGFYTHIGFEVYARFDFDAEGKEYPILHLKLKQ